MFQYTCKLDIITRFQCTQSEILLLLICIVTTFELTCIPKNVSNSFVVKFSDKMRDKQLVICEATQST